MAAIITAAADHGLGPGPPHNNDTNNSHGGKQGPDTVPASPMTTGGAFEMGAMFELESDSVEIYDRSNDGSQYSLRGKIVFEWNQLSLGMPGNTRHQDLGVSESLQAHHPPSSSSGPSNETMDTLHPSHPGPGAAVVLKGARVDFAGYARRSSNKSLEVPMFYAEDQIPTPVLLSSASGSLSSSASASTTAIATAAAASSSTSQVLPTATKHSRLQHSVPIDITLPGYLPDNVSIAVGSVRYELSATLDISYASGTPFHHEETVVIKQPIHVHRITYPSGHLQPRLFLGLDGGGVDIQVKVPRQIHCENMLLAIEMQTIPRTHRVRIRKARVVFEQIETDRTMGIQPPPQGLGKILPVANAVPVADIEVVNDETEDIDEEQDNFGLESTRSRSTSAASSLDGEGTPLRDAFIFGLDSTQARRTNPTTTLASTAASSASVPNSINSAQPPPQLFTTQIAQPMEVDYRQDPSLGFAQGHALPMQLVLSPEMCVDVHSSWIQVSHVLRVEVEYTVDAEDQPVRRDSVSPSSEVTSGEAGGDASFVNGGQVAAIEPGELPRAYSDLDIHHPQQPSASQSHQSHQSQQHDHHHHHLSPPPNPYATTDDGLHQDSVANLSAGSDHFESDASMAAALSAALNPTDHDDHCVPYELDEKQPVPEENDVSEGQHILEGESQGLGSPHSGISSPPPQSIGSSHGRHHSHRQHSHANGHSHYNPIIQVATEEIPIRVVRVVKMGLVDASTLAQAAGEVENGLPTYESVIEDTGLPDYVEEKDTSEDEETGESSGTGVRATVEENRAIGEGTTGTITTAATDEQASVLHLVATDTSVNDEHELQNQEDLASLAASEAGAGEASPR